MDSAKQYPRRPQIVGLHAQFHDLAYRSIAQKVVGHLDCDFHRNLGGALVPFDLVPGFLVLGTAGATSYFFGAVGSGTADATYLLRRFNITDRPLDFLVPDFLAFAFVEPPHSHATATRKHR